MIQGIGVDIVEVERIRQAFARHGEKFAEKILAPIEQADYQSSHSKAQFVAKRFAMKEAFSKALGTGMRNGLSFAHIAIVHNDLGKPLVELSTEHAHLLAGANVHISVSDEKNTVVAFAVIEKLSLQ